MSLKRLTMFLTLEDRQDEVTPDSTAQILERSAESALTEDWHPLSQFNSDLEDQLSLMG